VCVCVCVCAALLLVEFTPKMKDLVSFAHTVVGPNLVNIVQKYCLSALFL